MSLSEGSWTATFFGAPHDGDEARDGGGGGGGGCEADGRGRDARYFGGAAAPFDGDTASAATTAYGFMDGSQGSRAGSAPTDVFTSSWVDGGNEGLITGSSQQQKASQWRPGRSDDGGGSGSAYGTSHWQQQQNQHRRPWQQRSHHRHHRNHHPPTPALDLVPSVASNGAEGSDVADEFAWLADELLQRAPTTAGFSAGPTVLATAAAVVDALRPSPPQRSVRSAEQPPGSQVGGSGQLGDDGRKSGDGGGGGVPPSPGETMVATPAPTLAASSAAGSLVSLGGGHSGCRLPGTCGSGGGSPELPLHDVGGSGGVRPGGSAGRGGTRVTAATATAAGTPEQLARLGVRLELRQRLWRRMAAREEAAATAADGGTSAGPRARVQRPFAGKYTCRRTPATRPSAVTGTGGPPSVMVAAAAAAKGGKRTASAVAAATDGGREAEARRRQRLAPVAAVATVAGQRRGGATLAGADENLHMQWPPRLLAPAGAAAPTAAAMPAPAVSTTAAASGTTVAAGRGEDDGCSAWLLSPFLGTLDAGSGAGGVTDTAGALPVTTATVPLWAAGASKTAPWAATAEGFGVPACGDDGSLDWLAELLQLERQPSTAVSAASGVEAGGDFLMSCDGGGHGGDNFSGRGTGDGCWLWSGVVVGCDDLGRGGSPTTAAETPQRAQLRQTLGAVAMGSRANSFLFSEADGLLDWDVGGGTGTE
ncbi:hypothetical protein HK405_006596, partial [Cladochytrium tenue]